MQVILKMVKNKFNNCRKLHCFGETAKNYGHKLHLLETLGLFSNESTLIIFVTASTATTHDLNCKKIKMHVHIKTSCAVSVLTQLQQGTG